MELSCFYNDALCHPFPVTMLLLEQISVVMHDDKLKREEGAAPATFEEVISKTLKSLDIKKKPTKEDILYTFSRLEGMRPKEVDPNNSTASDNSRKKSFASDYLKWVSQLDHEQVCMHVAGYDYDKARSLYTEVDRDSVLKLAKQKADSDWHGKMTEFEACLFGFGGGYGSGGEGSNEFDMKEDLKSAEASIKGLGF